METEAKKIAERMVESFTSDLKAFIFDNKLVDSRIVEKIITLSGFEAYISRHAEGSIIAYFINPYKVRRKCLYEMCGDKPSELVKACINKCVEREMEKISRDLANTIIEVANSLQS